MVERRLAFAINDIGIGTGLQHQPRNLDMPWPAVAEIGDLDQAGPTERVDVIDIDGGVEQHTHGVHVALLARRDQRGAAEAVADRQVRPVRDHQAQDVGAAKCAGQQPRRIEIAGLRVDTCALREQQLDCFDPVVDDGQIERRAQALIAHVDFGADVDQPVDRRRIAALGSVHHGEALALGVGLGRLSGVCGRDEQKQGKGRIF